METLNLTSDRLKLRLFLPENITDSYLSALNDHSIIGLTEARHKKWDIELAKQFITNANNESSRLFMIMLKETGTPIGNVRLFNINKNHLHAELSFLFYDKSQWGKGYATEAIQVILDFAKNKLKLHRVFADYYEINIASSKVFNKLNFSIEGKYKEHFRMADGKFVDSIRVGIIL
jgi:RimJ/RimL family protein N-acetyltransferase